MTQRDKYLARAGECEAAAERADGDDRLSLLVLAQRFRRLARHADPDAAVEAKSQASEDEPPAPASPERKVPPSS